MMTFDPLDLIAIGLAVTFVGVMIACWFWPVKIRLVSSTPARELTDDEKLTLASNAIAAASLSASIVPPQ